MESATPAGVATRKEQDSAGHAAGSLILPATGKPNEVAKMSTHSAASAVIKPIETLYRGHRMRSRLEARWAVFMDCMGIDWDYEKEGYELGGGLRYLPDFWIPKLNLWMEVKGQQDAGWDIKAQELSAKHRPIAVFIGACAPPVGLSDCGTKNAAAFCENGRWIYRSSEDTTPRFRHAWSACDACRTLSIESVFQECSHIGSGPFHPALMASFSIAKNFRLDDKDLTRLAEPDRLLQYRRSVESLGMGTVVGSRGYADAFEEAAEAGREDFIEGNY